MPSQPASAVASSSRSASSSSSGSGSASDSDSDDDSLAVLSSTVTSLNAALSSLEHVHLGPLLARPLKETLAATAQQGGDVEQAKTLVTLAYVIEDLVWIYLKTQGLDPATHPVVPELQRVKTYFTKLAQAADPAPRRTMPIDRPAAARFIRSALASNGLDDRSASTDIGMQTRFNVLKHQEAALGRGPTGTATGDAEGASSSEDEGEGEESEEEEGVIKLSKGNPRPSSAAKGKGKAPAPIALSTDGSDSDVVVVDGDERERAVGFAGSKRGAGGEAAGGAAGGGREKGKRPRVQDPFAGYDSPASSTRSPAGTPQSSAKRPSRSAGAKGGKRA